ncbi:MAG: hypothetical protein AAF757_26235 [Cyanobacteria bacterium P01_D01_bin.116]
MDHQLPITNYQLPTTNYQLPITNYPFQKLPNRKYLRNYHKADTV